MAFSLIANTSGIQNTSAIDTTGSNLIIVFTSYDSGATISDNKGNTWIALTAGGSSTFGRFYYCINPIVGSGHIFTISISYGAIFVAAFSGQKSKNDLENGSTVTGTSLATGSITPTANDSLVVSGLALGGNGSSPSINSSFTITNSRNAVNGVSFGGSLAYIIQTSATAVNPTWSWTNSVAAVARITNFIFVIEGGSPIFFGNTAIA